MIHYYQFSKPKNYNIHLLKIFYKKLIINYLNFKIYNGRIAKDFLFVLIKSLSTSEKRQFKLYVNRLGINVDAKFLLLFPKWKMKEYDEDIISKNIYQTTTF
jgi:hypothetical protein